MRRTDWIRIVLCGYVAGVLWFLVSVVFLSFFAPNFVTSVQQRRAVCGLGRSVLLRGRRGDGHLGGVAVCGHRSAIRGETVDRCARGRCVVDDQELAEREMGGARVPSTRRRSHRTGDRVAGRCGRGVHSRRWAVRQGQQAGRPEACDHMKSGRVRRIFRATSRLDRCLATPGRGRPVEGSVYGSGGLLGANGQRLLRLACREP